MKSYCITMALVTSLGLLGTSTGCAVSSSTSETSSAPDTNDETTLLNEESQAASAVGAPSPQAAGDTANVCSSNLTPSGWVDVQWWNTFSCGNTFSPNAKQIKQLTGYAVGTHVNACSSSYPPAGWSITSSYYSSSCQYSSVPSFNNNSWTLVRSY
jgi:hypothetical protein